MGTINHHVVIVIGWYEDIEKAHKKAVELYPHVSNLIKSGSNGYASFMLGCDGSKEGWEESNKCEIARSKFILWLDKQKSKLNLEYSLISFHEANGFEPIIERTHNTDWEN